MCDTLVQLDPVTGVATPGIAASWTITDEGRTITFKLRKDLRFHHTGTPLTARDVTFSFNRLADPKEGSYSASVLAPLTGWSDYRAATKPAATLAGVQTVDDHAIQVRLVTADSDAIRMFAHPATAPVSADAVEANPTTFSRQPVCVGPYQLASPVTPQATTFRMERDPGYSATSAAYTSSGRGYASVIDVRVYPDESAAHRAWAQGAVDVVALPTNGANHATGVEADRVQALSPHIEYIGVPTAAAAGTALAGFDQAAVRQALSLALDRQRIGASVDAGVRTAADGFIPSRLAGGDLPGCSAVPERPDRAKARARLADAGVTLAGRTVPLYYNNEFGHGRLVREIAAQWRDAFGLTVTPRPLSWDALVDKAAQGSGLDGLFRFSWTDERLSAEGFLRPMVTDLTTGPNLARYSGPASDRILFELDRAEAGDRRLALRDLNSELCDQLPAIPVVVGRAVWLIRSTMVGRARDEVIGIDGRLILRELYSRAAGRSSVHPGHTGPAT